MKYLFIFLFIFISYTLQAQSLYVVQKGDTFTSISQNTGMSIAELRELNAYSKNSTLQVGTTIFVKYLKKNTALKYHTVKQNETLYSIAKLYHISVSKLKRLNNLDGNTIALGQVLVVK